MFFYMASDSAWLWGSGDRVLALVHQKVKMEAGEMLSW